MNLISYLTPINLGDEKERFFASNTYNPQLRYLHDELEVIDWVNTRPELQDFVNAIRSQDSFQIQQAASDLFDTKISPEILDLAKQIISIKPEKVPQKLNRIEEVVNAFSQAFRTLGLDGYTIEISDQHGFNFRPSAKDKKITVSKHLNLDFFSIDGEVKHELVHILRYENGKYNNIAVAENYLPTEEGLATYSQDYAGENGRVSLFQHAAEYTMTEVALKGSLRDVTDYLESIGFSKELAWQRAIRHKFGFVDTSKPGDIMKPSMYFYHQQIIKELTLDEKYRLFVGKITKDQLNEFTTYQGLVSLDRLYEMYDWKNSL